MEMIVAKNYEELSQISAQMIAEFIQKKQDAVLGLATGSTPVGMYKKLIGYHNKEGLDFSKIITFNLDEYVGISPNHPQSYHKFMKETFFSHINISTSNIHIPRGDQPQIEKQCESYEQAIKDAGGIDIQVLGIGSNGHIGFNEPGSSPEEKTRVVQLTESTIQANARFFGDEALVPRLAISMGIKTILESSKKIILLASGEEKANAVQGMIEGEISTQLPASLLQLHKNVIVIADQPAAKNLKMINKSLNSVYV
ncbi:glucosamine-6-phosphate deaminase [Mesobacillus subterraneus]|uniref:Glucosamine-6-phosphate deaminase n=1 Tax=Mesobacillus subterraneus TaxID=285983 RepID=A0A0D6ZE54_9BACI|nr:glucosamine-6-phosphate deaminase [Mesobacillus subterraneus]KIY23802.1 glucosamine-6-phosphate deaminase [Mesobacillus subterraneus]